MEDDRAARFRVLVVPQLAYLQRMARALTRDRGAAEDLVQESVLRGLRYFDSYRGEDFRAWMATIMRNLNRERPALQSATRVDGGEEDEDRLARLPDPAPDPEERLLAGDRAARVRGLVAALPEAMREIIVLREFGGLSYTQIATALSLPVGTVMSRLARARLQLRADWTAGDGGCAP
jgi:RNA polymerase sigma-70 factor, ECF subfamily